MNEELAPAARLLWGPPPKAGRGPKASLTLDRIARAGIDIADAEGLGALSMQRVAGLLDVTKMALYRYVPGKAELVALMVDAAVGAAPPVTGTGWRDPLADWSRQLAAVFRLHPWLLDATVGPRLVGPAELSWMERAVAALADTPLTGAERLDVVAVLAGHVRAISQQSRAAGPEGSPEQQLLATLGTLIATHQDSYPATAAAMAEAAQSDGQDQALEFGLRCFLDGLGVRIA
ncbi:MULTISPECIES: TetR/AcrR family transcriptional regulator [unclassified Kitasatospora]|uniref:TetR/AcrR family transcriptional regulator n=1 Tax=unclassified Kitasatospora TaxID=2633591 RepID=UPI00070951BD|nr:MULTISPECIES: TetR/AcrR family transcriptional regulator C-terminal domain-containing protein [unclassified Kitasatospora]KQV24016.1 TetR family transcriptional regulator [Kitasatospora sp. Root107]KRB67270.1 TetR family transcriptional regulator [Kitasatospora sp. Root187]